MKANKSIRYKLLQYLIGFVLLMLGALFLVQTVFLEDFYKAIKTQEIRTIAEYLLEHADEEDVEDLPNFPLRGEMCIHLFDASGNLLKSLDRFRECRVQKMSTAELAVLYQNTTTNHNGEQAIITAGGRASDGTAGTNSTSRPTTGVPRQEEMLFVMTDDDLMVTIESVLTPMTATISVLRVQLFYATGILIVAAGILAFILSKKIAQPIIDIHHATQKLIDGEYDLVLSDKSYREIIELNQTLQHTSKELKKADRMQKELIANISHDLRTPLTMIIGYAEVMRDLPNEKNEENVQVIIDEAQRLSRLVDDILAISKSSVEIPRLKHDKMELTALVENIVERCRRLTEAEGYRFEFESTEPFVIEGDEGKLSQVFYNLLGNAITHTGKDKTIYIQIMRRQEKEKSFVRVCIIDTGEGIAPEHLRNIWDRYYKVDKTHVRATVATGLGLSIVKNIMTAHGGRYGVDSELGKGSCFWVELPLKE